jgi:diguanylate cyclase (GGDEF)-like protein
MPVEHAANREPAPINKRAELEGLVQAEAVQLSGCFAAIAIDLDELKDVNDTEGHASGDEYLRTARAVLQASVRHPGDAEPAHATGDLLAEGRALHVHGDEYWVILRHVSTEQQVQAFITRLKEVLDDYGIGASMGGRVHEPGESVGDLLADADELLYQDKMARALSAHRLTAEEEEQLRRCQEVIRRLGFTSLRSAQKYYTAMGWRDGSQDSQRRLRTPID